MDVKRRKKRNKNLRVTSWLWVGSGLTIMVTGFFGLLWLMIAVFVIRALGPFVYSYVLHRKEI